MVGRGVASMCDGPEPASTHSPIFLHVESIYSLVVVTMMMAVRMLVMLVVVMVAVVMGR